MKKKMGSKAMVLKQAGGGAHWLMFLDHTEDSLWSAELSLACKSMGAKFCRTRMVIEFVTRRLNLAIIGSRSHTVLHDDRWSKGKVPGFSIPFICPTNNRSQ